MQFEFSLTYDSSNEYCEIGYHTTKLIYKKSIEKNGFKPSHEPNDWLGEGVYFWDDEQNAEWWREQEKSDLFPTCIFVCNLKCDKLNYLNLDDDNEMKEFELFCKKYLSALANQHKTKPKFTKNDQKRKFFCDIYCKNNNIDILSFTFLHDKINEFGFKRKVIARRQICVRNVDCISIIKVKE